MFLMEGLTAKITLVRAPAGDYSRLVFSDADFGIWVHRPCDAWRGADPAHEE